MTKGQSNYIKLIAIVTMLVDHMGILLFPGIPIFRIIGRIAFPLFAYQIGVSYGHVGDFKKYISKLLACALIFQGFYILASRMDPAIEPGYLNIFFTLTLGLALIWLVDHQKWVLTAGACLIPVFIPAIGLTMDYGLYGAALILFLYLLRGRLVWLGLYLGASAFLYGYLTPGASYVQMFCLLALLFLAKPLEVKLKIPGWFFYLFYPSHLALLYGVQWLTMVT
jgi:hypothetical protein